MAYEDSRASATLERKDGQRKGGASAIQEALTKAITLGLPKYAFHMFVIHTHTHTTHGINTY